MDWRVLPALEVGSARCARALSIDRRMEPFFAAESDKRLRLAPSAGRARCMTRRARFLAAALATRLALGTTA